MKNDKKSKLKHIKPKNKQLVKQKSKKKQDSRKKKQRKILQRWKPIQDQCCTDCESA